MFYQKVFCSLFVIFLLQAYLNSFSSDIVNANLSTTVIDERVSELLSENELHEYLTLLEEKNFTNWMKNYYSPERISERLLIDNEFAEFNLLKCFSKRITLIYYKKQNILSPQAHPWDFSVDDSDCIKFIIDDSDELVLWQKALKNTFSRKFTSPFTPRSIASSQKDFLLHPFGIIIETDKREVFIWITNFGFHLGSWENNGFNFDREFYFPDLALVLIQYLEDHSLVPVSGISQDSTKLYLPQIPFEFLAGAGLNREQKEAQQLYDRMWEKDSERLKDKGY